MTVFRGYLKGALRQRTVICLYLVIFLGLGTLMTMSMDETNQETYNAKTITIAVIDRDKSSVSEGLKSYLADSQEVVEMKDQKETLKEELYYGNIQYVLVIPAGFEEKLVAGIGTDSEHAVENSNAENKANAENLLEGTGRPGSVQNHYASELADSYLSGIAMYLQTGDTPAEAVEHMKNLDIPDSLTVMQEGTGSMSKVAGTLQYLPYVLTALSCYVVGFVMLDHQRTEIRRRLAVSAVSPARRTFQMLLAMAVIGVAFYAVSIFMVALMNPGRILKEPNPGFYLVNVAVMVLVGLTIAFFVVQIARTGNGINGLANVIALGMSFICGVFIPDTMLSASVKRVAKFLPVYWYERNNEILGTHSELTHSLIVQLRNGYTRQLIFVAGLLVCALVIGRVRERH